MLNPERIPIGKLKQSFGLNPLDVDALLSALWPHYVFPCELWEKAYAHFWRGELYSYEEYIQTKYHVFPEIKIDADDYFSIMRFSEKIYIVLSEVVGLVSVGLVSQGLEYIAAETYEDTSDVYKQQRDSLYAKLAEAESSLKPSYIYIMDAKLFREVSLAKWDAVRRNGLAFYREMFIDAIIVNKVAAIRHLFGCGYPLRQEVKGLSKAIVERIIADVPVAHAGAHAQVQGQSHAGAPRRTVYVPRVLWEGKTHRAACKEMQGNEIPEAAIVHILYERCGLTNKTQIARLMGTHPKKIRGYLAEAEKLNIVDS